VGLVNLEVECVLSEVIDCVEGKVVYLKSLFLLAILITTLLSVDTGVVDETSSLVDAGVSYLNSVDIGVDVDVENDSVELGIGEYEFITLGIVIKMGDTLVDSVVETEVIKVEEVDTVVRGVEEVDAEVTIVEEIVDVAKIFLSSLGNL